MARYHVTRYQVSLGNLRAIGEDGIVEVPAGIRVVGQGAFVDFVFVPEGTPQPESVTEPLVTTFRPFSEYARYLDLLRNEKPVYLDVYDDEPDRNGISTGHERVGDGERSR